MACVPDAPTVVSVYTSAKLVGNDQKVMPLKTTVDGTRTVIGMRVVTEPAVANSAPVPAVGAALKTPLGVIVPIDAGETLQATVCSGIAPPNWSLTVAANVCVHVTGIDVNADATRTLAGEIVLLSAGSPTAS